MTAPGDGQVGRTFGAIALGLLGLVALLGWLGFAGVLALGYIVGSATGTVSMDGGQLLLLATTLTIPLGLLAGGVAWALPRRRE